MFEVNRINKQTMLEGICTLGATLASMWLNHDTRAELEHWRQVALHERERAEHLQEKVTYYDAVRKELIDAGVKVWADSNTGEISVELPECECCEEEEECEEIRPWWFFWKKS